ncbi:hypothetical protein [Spirillospora sp. NPDC047279]|uniref:hypothetical protein n=1 Tax=Spirillospora sp. NPDC047279 TaxID=3155478 RepID=UPI0033CC9732
MRRVLVAHGSAGAALLIAAAPVQAAERTPPPRADLRVDLTGPERRVKAGDVVGYRVRLRNAGPSAAGRAVTTIRLPRGLAVVAVSDPGCRDRGRVLRCRTAALAAGMSRTLHIQGIVKPAARGVHRARARVTITGAVTDPDLHDNASVLITRVMPSTDLAVRLIVPRRVRPRGSFLLAAAVVNRGPRAARGVTLHLGAHGARMAVSRRCRSTGERDGGHFLRCSLGRLAVGDQRTFYVPVRATAERGTAQSFAVTVSTALGDRSPADNTAIARVRVTRGG